LHGREFNLHNSLALSISFKDYDLSATGDVFPSMKGNGLWSFLEVFLESIPIRDFRSDDHIGWHLSPPLLSL